MTDEHEKEGPRTVLFFILTGLYLAAVIVGAWMLGYLDPAGKRISPSEWGDVLAGVFSPLAFLWLIYASLSQRAELELQRRELSQNNVTQGEQREEMRRQVDAMTAQAKLLEAQAAATFDPVFIIDELSTYRDGYLAVIINHGCAIVSAYMQGSFTVAGYNGYGVGYDDDDNLVYYWAAGSKVTCITRPLAEDALHEVAIQYTRKDGATKRNVYLLNLVKGSLRLVQSDIVMPSKGHK